MKALIVILGLVAVLGGLGAEKADRDVGVSGLIPIGIVCIIGGSCLVLSARKNLRTEKPSTISEEQKLSGYILALLGLIMLTLRFFLFRS